MSRSTLLSLASLVLLSVQAVSILPLVSAVAMGESVSEVNEAEEKLQLAFDALSRADEFGASDMEVFELAERLNTALSLLTEAKAVQASGNSSLVTEYASRSIATSDGVREEAEHLRETVSKTLFSSGAALVALAPVIGLIAAVIFYFAYRARRRPGTEKILRMGIGRKEERG